MVSHGPASKCLWRLDRQLLVYFFYVCYVEKGSFPSPSALALYIFFTFTLVINNQGRLPTFRFRASQGPGGSFSSISRRPSDHLRCSQRIASNGRFGRWQYVHVGDYQRSVLLLPCWQHASCVCDPIASCARSGEHSAARMWRRTQCSIYQSSR